MRKHDLAAIVAEVERLAANTSEQAAADVLDHLSEKHGPRRRFANGAHELSLAGIRCSCTAGRYPLLRQCWRRHGRSWPRTTASIAGAAVRADRAEG